MTTVPLETGSARAAVAQVSFGPGGGRVRIVEENGEYLLLTYGFNPPYAPDTGHGDNWVVSGRFTLP